MKTFSAALLTLVLAFPAFAETPQAPTKEDRVRAMLNAMNIGAMGIQIMEQVIDAMKPMAPDAPEEYWKTFRGQLKPEEFVDVLVPIYAKHLTDEEIAGLTTFFTSPVGRSFIGKQAAIAQDSMAAGGQWGERLAQRAIEELMKKKQQ